MSFLLPASLAKHLSGSKTPDGTGSRTPAKTAPSARGAPTAARLFTAEEVAQHATESDCYTIVEGRVYDVTKYLKLHPGGVKLLYKNAGGDSTADFLALRHSAKSRIILDQYYVGDLAGSAPRTLNVPGGVAGGAPAPMRKVGALVGPQPFLGIALPHNGAPSSSGGSVTPCPAQPAVPAIPRPNKLHPSSSHPDRLSAYTSFNQEQQLKQQQQQGGGTPLVASSGLAINLLPPSATPSPSPPPPTFGGTKLPLHRPSNARRSPTTLALEKHLSEEKNLSPPLDEAGNVIVMEDVLPPPQQFPSFKSRPSVPMFSATVTPPSFAHSTATAASASASAAAISSTVAPAVAIASPPTAADAGASSFGPRRFILKQRTQQSAPDVQLLEFEPVACSALDPALWLHIPPGQHVSIGLTLPSGEYVKRPYTPVTNVRGRFELLVKDYSYGIVSRALHALPVGGAAEVFGPAGRFDFERALRERKHWIMLAQGTGIAPLYQLIKHIRMEATSSASDGAASSSDADAAAAARHLHMYLLDCNRNESEILLRDELAQLQAESQGKLAIQHVLSKPLVAPSSPDVMSGRLNADILARFLAPLPFLPLASASSASASAAAPPAVASSATPSPFLFLLCGSDEFHADVSAMLMHSQLVQPRDIFLF